MKEKILVVNDENDIREIARIILQTAGYEAIGASNGMIGIKEAIDKKPDLILLDIMMPEMDGYETCRKLKAEPQTKDIPVIFMSALSSPKDKILGLTCGAVDFISNSVDRGELLARVKTHLEIQSLSRALRQTNEALVQKQQSLNHDLYAASIIQKSFLPPKDLKLKEIEMASFWQPLNKIGGDIFNAVQYGEEKAVFYVVDVSGHDVPSSLVTVSISQSLNQINASSKELPGPKKMLEMLDSEYPMERFDRYFTIFYLVLDYKKKNITYSSAGHPPAIILKKNRNYKMLDSGGPIIGLNMSLPFEEGEEAVEEGDKIFLYSDGVGDVRNANGEFYGLKRFYDLLESLKDKPVDKIIDKVCLSIKAFAEVEALHDDICIMGFELQFK